MKIVIVGGGASGSNCAARLRRLDEKAEIIIIEKTEETAIGTCGLPYYFSGVIADRESMVVTKPDDFKKFMNIETYINSEVTELNRKEKYVIVNGKEKVGYDKLVLAVGASSFKPDIKGINNGNVFFVKTLRDIDGIKDFVGKNAVKKAAVIGGGAIGIEMAEGFARLHIETSVIEAAGKLLPNTDEEIAAFAQNELRKHGINLFLSETAEEILEKSVKLKSGKKIDCDIVVLATGAIPDTSIAKDCGLAAGLKGAIIVDEYMRTSDEDIYACGDSVQTKNFITNDYALIQLAGPAGKQGRLVANNICGMKIKYRKSAGAAIVKVFDLSVASVGLTEKQLIEKNIKYKKIHIWSNSHVSYYPEAKPILIKLLFDFGGKILGAQAVSGEGADKRIDVISTTMKLGGTVQDLAESELCYAPPYSSAKDPVNIAGMAASNILNGFLKPVFAEDISENDMLIDLRSESSFKEETIKGAINIPAYTIRNCINKIPKDKKVVLFCFKGLTAYNILKMLKQHGYDNVYSLSGGFNLYKEIMKNKK